MSSVAPPLPTPMAPPTAASEPSPGLDESLYEVVGGRIVEKPVMGALQSNVAMNLAFFLSMHVRRNKLGRVQTEMLFLLDKMDELKRRPDVSFVSFTRWPRSQAVPNVEAWGVVPELAVEVISPTNTAEGVLTKLAEYFRKGCERVWVVYPVDRQVYVYRSPTQNDILTHADELDGETAVPGFRLAVAKIFDDETAE